MASAYETILRHRYGIFSSACDPVAPGYLDNRATMAAGRDFARALISRGIQAGLAISITATMAQSVTLPDGVSKADAEKLMPLARRIARKYGVTVRLDQEWAELYTPPTDGASKIWMTAFVFDKPGS